MSDITRIINKYYTKDGKNMTATQKRNPYEQTNPEYTNKRKQEQKCNQRHIILKTLINEVPFHVTKDQENQIRYWINQFNKDFKNFHRQASNETIILAFIFIHRKHDKKRIEVEEYSISKKYHLTDKKFKVIQNNLIFKLMQTTPLQYNQKICLDNDILNKKGL